MRMRSTTRARHPVRPDQVENLRQWFNQLETDRRDEVIATLIDETVSQETAVLIPNNGNPILVYAMEVDDPVQSKASANSGKHPIDAEHRAVMQAAVSGVPDHETVLDISPRKRCRSPSRTPLDNALRYSRSRPDQDRTTSTKCGATVSHPVAPDFSRYPTQVVSPH